MYNRVWVDFLNVLASKWLSHSTHLPFINIDWVVELQSHTSHVFILKQKYGQTRDCLFSQTLFVKPFSLATFYITYTVWSENTQKFVEIVTERTRWTKQSSKCKRNLPRQSLSNEQYRFRQPNKNLMFILRVLLTYLSWFGCDA